jgi:hypothetical protein
MLRLDLFLQYKEMFSLCTHCKKRLAVFPSPAGMAFTKLSLDGNNLVFLQYRSSIAADNSGAWLSKKTVSHYLFHNDFCINGFNNFQEVLLYYSSFLLYYSIYKYIDMIRYLTYSGDVVYLGWPIAPSYMSPNAGGGGCLAGSQPMNTAVHMEPK